MVTFIQVIDGSNLANIQHIVKLVFSSNQQKWRVQSQWDYHIPFLAFKVVITTNKLVPMADCFGKVMCVC